MLGGYKANIRQPPKRGQPLKRGQRPRSQSVLCSEVLLYTAVSCKGFGNGSAKTCKCEAAHVLHKNVYMCSFVCYSYFTVQSSTVTIHHLFVMEMWLALLHRLPYVDTMHHKAIEGESAKCA